MPTRTLHNVQARMAASLRGGDPVPALLGEIAPTPGFDAAARLGVYRNNIAHGLQAALAATFPVVEQLVGADFFTRLTRDFVAAHPPRSGPLLEWGERLPGFLDGYVPARTVAYLGDVARLEWAAHEAFHATDVPALDPAALKRVPMDLMGHVVLRLHPATRLVGSGHPVFSIWNLHQPGQNIDDGVDLDAGGECALITRPARTVNVKALTLCEFVFFTHLQRGEAVGAAFEAAMQQDRDFDLAHALQLSLEGGAFRHFYIQEKE